MAIIASFIIAPGLLALAGPSAASAAPASATAAAEPDAPASVAMPAAVPAAEVAPGPIDPWAAYHVGFQPVRAVRAFDGRIARSATQRIDMTSVLGVPLVDVDAVALRVRVRGAQAAAGVTVWGSGGRPSNATMLVPRAADRTQLVIVGLPASGTVSLQARLAAVDATVELVGYVPDASSYNAVEPVRVFDNGGSGAALSANSTTTVRLGGVGGLPIGAAAVVVQVGVVSASTDTAVTVWPTGAPRPTSPDLTAAAADRGVSTTTIVPVGADGAVQLHNAAGTTRATLDVVGWFAARGDYRPLARTTVRTGPAVADSTSTVALAAGMPGDAGVAVISLRSTSTAPASVTAFPAGTERPSTPTTTVGAGRSEQIAMVPLGLDGSIVLHTTSALTDLSVDLLGTFARAALAPPGSSWQFDPSGWVTFTAAGQTRYADLVNLGADGRPTGAYLPAGTSWAVAGNAGAVEVRVVGRGRVRVRSTDVIGSVNVVAVPVVGDQGQPLVAKNLRLQPGVQVVRDNRVLYPAPNAVGGGSPAPFTMTEVMARTSLPDADTADPFNSGARVGVVLTGRAPAVGTLLAGIGGSGVSGRVVAPAGLPSINRSGSSLVTVEFVSPTDLYEEMSYEIDYATGVRVGSNGAVTSTVTPLETSFRSRPTVAASTASGYRRQAVPAPGSGPCSAEANLVAKAEFKLLSIEAPTPIITGEYRQVVHGRSLHRLQVNMGVQWNGKAETSLTVQTEAQFKFECTLKEVAAYDPPSPEPHLATAASEAKVIFAGEIVVPAGPKVEMKYTCEWNIDKQFVVNWSATSPETLDVRRPSDFATSTCAPSASFVSTLLPRKVEMKVGVYANAGAGLRVFGVIAEALGKATGKTDLGVLEFIDLRYGPETKFDWETDHEVLRNEKAESKVVTQMVTEGTFKTPDVQSLLSKFRVHVGFQPSIKLFEVTAQTDAWYRAPSGSTPSVTVNGDDVSGETITVYPGDEVRVESELQYPNLGTMRLPDAAIIGGTDWIETAPSVWERFDGFTSTAGSPAPMLVATTTITPAMCQSLLEPRAIAFLPTTKMLDTAPTAGYAGKVTFQCGRPTLRFEPDSVSFRPFETGGSIRTVQLVSEHAKGLLWAFVNDDTIPAWLTVSDRAGGRFEDDPDTWDIQLSVDCSKVEGSGASTVLTASVGDALGRNTSASLSVSTECNDEYIEVDPSTLVDGGSVNVVTSGRAEDRWTMGPLPSWAKASVRFRDLEPGLSSGPVSFTIDRKPTCQVQPEVRARVTFTTTDRGEAVLELVRTRIGAITPCPTAQSKGDPHIVTADGQQFDAQVVGEYVYERSDSGDFVLSARHAASWVPGVGRPTSVTGVSILTDGATIEVYAHRAPGVGRVFIDGEAVEIDPAVPLAVTDTVRVTRQADAGGAGFDSYTISGPDGVLLAEQLGTVLDITFSFPETRSDVSGLLGSPDGDPTNDLVPRGATVGYTLEEIRLHGPALYALTDSWRTTDIAESMFTVPDDVFDDHNWPMDAAALAPFREQAFAALGSITNVCGGDQPGVNDYVVDALAFELSIGTSIGDLGRFTCNYVATARTLTAVGGYPVLGVQVTFDAPGLRPCTAVSSVDGAATCRLVVDLDELAGATGPLTVTATAAWPDTPGEIATTTIPVIAKAPLDSTPLRIEGNLSIPVEVPQVVLSGTLRNDVVTPRPWTFQFLAHDADGRLVGTNEVSVTPAADGTYAVTVPMPPRAVDVSVDVILTGFVRDRHDVSGLQPGTTTAATIDVDDRAQQLRISGVMKYNGVPALGAGTTRSTLAIDERDAAGRLIAWSAVDPTIDPTTGAYVVEVELTSITRTVELRAFVATDVPERRVVVSTTVPGLAPGATTSTTFDALADRARVLISGTARQGGEPASDHYAVVLMYDADGSPVGGRSVFVDVDPVTARYTLDPELDPRTVWVTVRFQVGALPSDNPLLEVPGIVPGVTTEVPFDFDVGNRNLVISGIARLGGTPAVAGTELDITLTPYDSSGEPIVVTGPFGSAEFGTRTSVGANGVYQSTPIALPAGTAEVRGRVRIANVDTPFVAAVTDGANATTVDLDTVELVLHGRYELPDDGIVFVTSAAPPTAPLQGVGAFVVTPEGTYTVTLQFPVGTTDARVGIAFRTESTVITDLTAGSNDREFDWVPPETIGVSATVTRNGAPALDVTTARLRVRAYRVEEDDTFVLLEEVALDGVPVTGGSIDTTVPVPPGTTLVDIDMAPGDSDAWGRLGAYAVDPGGAVSGLQFELLQYVEVTFAYTDAAPACRPKIRAVDQWIVPVDAGSVPFDGTGYPAPAIPLGTTLVVPSADFTEVLRIPVPGYFSVGVLSRARGDWTSLFEPVAMFQTLPINGSTGIGVSNSRASYGCDVP